MAFITNQWLLGDAIRDRSYSPHKVTIEASNANGKWSQTNQVLVDLKLSKENHDYHLVSLTQNDLASILPELIYKSDVSTKIKIAMDILMHFNDDVFNLIVAETLVARDKLAANRQ